MFIHLLQGLSYALVGSILFSSEVCSGASFSTWSKILQSDIELSSTAYEGRSQHAGNYQEEA